MCTYYSPFLLQPKLHYLGVHLQCNLSYAELPYGIHHNAVFTVLRCYGYKSNVTQSSPLCDCT